MKHLKLVALANVVALLLILFTRSCPPAPWMARRPCPGSLATRLKVGDRGQVAQRFSSLRSSPGGPVIRVMGAGATFTVLEGPQCGNTLTHYRIDYGNGVTAGPRKARFTASTAITSTGWLRSRPRRRPPRRPPPRPPRHELPWLPAAAPDRGRTRDGGPVLQHAAQQPGRSPIRIVGNGAAFTVLEGRSAPGRDR
jgi:hypothetical protein